MIGQMKDRINVKFNKKEDNGRGGWTLTELDMGTFWGEIRPASARNIIQYRQADMNTNTTIIMRANANINKFCTLYARGSKYTIEEIIPEGQYLKITAVGEEINEQSG